MSNFSPAEVLQKLQLSEFSAVENAIITFLKGSAEHDIIGVSATFNAQQALNIRCRFIDEWADIIVNLFKTKNYIPARSFLEDILKLKHAFDWLFSASHLTNTDTLIDHLALFKPDINGQLTMDGQKLLLLLSLSCLNSAYRLPWAGFMKAQPGITLTAYISLINQTIPAISQESSDGFNYLLESAKDFPTLELTEIYDINKFLGSLFHCSYATSPNKYEFKKWLTKLIRFNCEKSWLTGEVKEKLSNLPKQTTLNKNQKPKMLVMIEKFHASHAMARCFTNILNELSIKYYLIGLSTKKNVDESACNLFNKMYFIENEFSLSNNVDLVLSTKADVIFYPSIGMKLWSILLSQLRLAPKQIMMGGHPSSSYSTEIDNLILPAHISDTKNLQQFYNEKIISLSDSTEHYMDFHTMSLELTNEFITKNQILNANNDKIKIGINGVITKVTNDIINVCQRIEKEALKKVTFIFYVKSPKNSVASLAINNILSKSLQRIELHHYQGYLPYMKSISECHFLLPTLPFGGSNSNVDAMVLSRPKLFIKGTKEIYTRADYFEWNRMGLADELGCDSIDELVKRALRLIKDDKYRKELHALIQKKCTLEHIFTNKKKGNGKDLINSLFAKALQNKTAHMNDAE